MTPLTGSRALVTGGAGFVGSHIVDLLVAEGVSEIVVLDNFTRGHRENLERASGHSAVRVVEGDIRDQTLVADLVRNADYVFHQAAIRITEAAAHPRLGFDVLAAGTFNVAHAAATQRCKRLIVASSASIYGAAECFPTSEQHHPYNGRTLYGAAKMFAEGMLRAMHDMYGLSYVALRYFNIYGPRMDRHGVHTEVLVRWIDQLLAGQQPVIHGDGTQTLDLVYVEDVARANILAAKSEVVDDVFNIASGTETSLNDLLRHVLRALNSDVSPQYGPARGVYSIPRRLADTSKARRVIGFEATTTLERGLDNLVQWMQEHGKTTTR